ncbi:MAG TPA: glycosyltransferase family 39 protein [Chitinophagales bacterium]|nr:glycosyltransferase family 39 protein [Chitinophagales bacterium]
MQKGRVLFIFLAGLVLVNVLQCFFTELLHDEAYYWLWSKDLAWGYFDHPPMVALFIRLGDTLMHAELGVRLLFILANATTVYLLYHIIKPANLKLFYVLLLSITPLLALGFFAVPDIPLLFFAACFFAVYQKYLDDDSVSTAVLLGACMACMLYSKYHGVLVIFFVLLSNLQLLRRKTFYLACFTGVLMFTPHLWWQWQNDFPTFRFHLFERSREVYSWMRTTDYVAGQLILAGIPAGLLLLYAAVKYKAKNKFQRALQFQLWGTYLFFLISSFKGRTEANWTIANVIPLTILCYRFFEVNPKPARWLLFLLPVSLLSIIGLRVHYGTSFTKNYLGIQSETQHWKEWADTIAVHAVNRPVVFLSSYQKASKYTFYTGKTAFSTTEVEMRRSQYNLLNIEDDIQNKEVYVCTYWGFMPDGAKTHDKLITRATNFDGFVVDSFLSWYKVVITPFKKAYTATTGSEIVVPVKVVSPYKDHPLPNEYSRLTYRIYEGKTKLGDYETDILLEPVLATRQAEVKVKPPVKPGQYRIFISATQDNFPPPINSTAVEVEVK